jgi:hypothetical protein
LYGVAIVSGDACTDHWRIPFASSCVTNGGVWMEARKVVNAEWRSRNVFILWEH